MGQSGYAQNFVNLMLGWIRQLASSVAGMFQSGGGGQSGGRALLEWFSAHWLALLLVLIALGVAVDWIVWMLRWRPYWLWFRKRRVILDDDIDQELDEEQLLRRYGIREEGPRFHSHALPREDQYDEYDEYYGYDEYDGQDEEEYDPEEDGEGYEAYVQDPFEDDGQEGLEDEGAYDEAYEDGEYAGEDGQQEAEEDAGTPGQYEPGYDGEDEPLDEGEDWDEDLADRPEEISPALQAPEQAERRRPKARPLSAGDEDDGWDDLPPKKPRRPLFGRKRREEEEDPFAVDEKAFQDLDDDFLQVVSEEPHPEADQDLRIYARPQARLQVPLEPLADKAREGDFDERIGYQSSFEPLSGTARSRKSRRRKTVDREEG